MQLKKNDVESNLVNLENNLALNRMVLAQYMGCEGDDWDVADAVPPSDELPGFPMQPRRDHEASLPLTPERLVIRMQKAWNDLEDAYKQMLIARQSIGQSVENLRLNGDYYRAGTTTMSDLMDAQTMFRHSHDKYVEAFAQYKIKIVEYRQATGQ